MTEKNVIKNHYLYLYQFLIDKWNNEIKNANSKKRYKSFEHNWVSKMYVFKAEHVTKIMHNEHAIWIILKCQYKRNSVIV